MKIWANCVVRNEENFIWFAIMSVADYVDKVLVWDSGSTDKTAEIVRKVREIKGSKVEFREVGPVGKEEFTEMRQKMLDESKCDWILILDGDEVWWDDSIKKVIGLIRKRGEEIDAIVNPFYNMVGDIYHCQTEESGRYEIAGRRGHLTIRAFNRKIPGLHLAGPYGEETYADEYGKPIQKRDPEKIVFMDAPFLHLTHLKRSSADDHQKTKYDKGLKFNKAFPEVFYLKRPAGIASPWKTRSKLYELLSFGKSILKI